MLLPLLCRLLQLIQGNQQAACQAPHQTVRPSLAPLQRRCAEAEARQQEAAARIPEATQPLMRQLEAMQVGLLEGVW